MKAKTTLILIIFSLFFALSVHAAFPPVPEGLTPVAFQHVGAFANHNANVRMWVQDGYVYLSFDPQPTWYLDGDPYYGIVQNSVDMNISDLSTEEDVAFFTTMYAPSTIRLTVLSLDPNQPFRLIHNGRQVTNIIEYDPSTPSSPIPSNGIWQSSDGVLSMYLQKYAAGSCALVVTMGDGLFTAWLDSDYSDGVSCANDLYANGYALTLSLTDTTHGTLTANLPGWGRIVTDVACKFSDIP